MTEEQKDTTSESGDEGATGASDSTSGNSAGADSGDGQRQSFSDGIKQGIGVLAAFKDALEETIQEARDRGDLSSEKAREVMKDAMGRAQTAAEGARERLDFATQAELRSLREAVDSLQSRVNALEAAAGIQPEAAGSDSSSEEEAPEEEG